MKLRTIFIVGILFIFGLGLAWLAKPPSLKHEFERAGLVLTYKGLSDNPDKNSIYTVRLSDTDRLVEVLLRSGFKEEVREPGWAPTLRSFNRKDPIRNWLFGSFDWVIIENKSDLEITTNPAFR